ncbi:MAG: zinc ABC transporter substrate-binding protein [Burkholderiaceae bacterium]
MLFSGVFRVLAAVSIAMGLCSTSGAVQAAPSVVVSINPLHSLVSALMKSVAAPVLLLPGSSSPHGWALRPSQARAIHQADLIVWVGPALEQSLARSVTASDNKGSQFSALAVPGLTLHNRRGGAEHHHDRAEADKHDADEHHHDEHDTASSTDPHIWLDPRNAILIVTALADRLAQIDPGNRDTYADNARKLLESIRLLAAEMRRDLAGVRGRKLVVYHDGFQYLERFVGLDESIVLTEEPELPRSVGQLSRLARKLGGADGPTLRCLFTEPQFDGRMARVLAQRYELTVEMIDLLGSQSGEGGYEAMMRGLTRSILGCGAAR